MFDHRSLLAQLPADWSPRGEEEALPEQFGKALDRLLPDFQRPGPVPLQIGFTRDGDERWLWFWETGPRGGSGFWIPDELPQLTDVTLTVALADWLQEQFFPETFTAWGQARPQCPGHPHPAKPVELDDQAWWVCPNNAKPIAVIGRLP